MIQGLLVYNEMPGFAARDPSHDSIHEKLLAQVSEPMQKPAGMDRIVQFNQGRSDGADEVARPND